MIAKRAPIPQIVQHHLEEAGFLWRLRQRAASSAEYTLDDLAQLDERLQAHLEGLLSAIEDGGQVNAEDWEESGPGVVFASTWLGLKEGKADEVITLVERTAQQPQFYSALLAAFSRVTRVSLQGIVKSLLIFPSGRIKQLGIEACIAHGVHPGRFLAGCFEDEDTALCIAGVQGCATLGLTDYVPAIAGLLAHHDTEVRVAAAGALLLLGDRNDALRALGELIGTVALTEYAATLMVCAVPMDRATELLKALAARPQGSSLLIQTVAANGDPAYVPWLLREMQKPLVARLAGYAFEAITGADIRRVARAEAPDSGPSRPGDESENVDADEQSDLPWPDAPKLTQWWGRNQHRWQAGTRYVLGNPLSTAACVETLKQGNQRQRALACRQLGLLNPGMPVFNIHAPAWWQRQQLLAM